jgi:hypothetical protein
MLQGFIKKFAECHQNRAHGNGKIATSDGNMHALTEFPLAATLG